MSVAIHDQEPIAIDASVFDEARYAMLDVATALAIDASVFYEARYAMLGVATALAAVPIIDYISGGISAALTTAKMLDPDDVQDVIAILHGIENIPYSLLKLAAKVAFIGYVAVIGPVLEEAIFRGQLYEEMDNVHEWIWGPNANELVQKITRVVINGVLFGAAHLSPFQGWSNLPIFVGCSVSGIVLAGLREYTGNAQASCSAHMVNNALCVMQQGLL